MLDTARRPLLLLVDDDINDEFIDEIPEDDIDEPPVESKSISDVVVIVDDVNTSSFA